MTKKGCFMSSSQCVVVVQIWGWYAGEICGGVEGYSLHISEGDRALFSESRLVDIKTYGQSFPVGGPYKSFVSEETFNEVLREGSVMFYSPILPLSRE